MVALEPVPVPTPSITSLSPTSGVVGSAVTITGMNFGSVQGSSAHELERRWHHRASADRSLYRQRRGHGQWHCERWRKLHSERWLSATVHYGIVANFWSGGYDGDDLGNELWQCARQQHGNL